MTWNNIAGATAATFTPDDNAGQVFGDQAGLRLRVAVSFTDGGGTAEQVISAATGPTGVNWDGNGANNSLVGTAGDDTGDGGGGNDVLSGNDGNDTLNGDGGNDTVNGGLGNDALTGGGGNDTLTGGAGNDSINGNGDNDVAVFAGPVGNYSVTTTGTSLVVTDNTGAEGVDTVSNVETLRFNGANYAVVAGTGGNNNLNGAAGSQAVFGFGGTDTLNGGAGNDIVNGGDGTDTITQTGATGGRDLVDGGAGTDTFVLNGVAGAETFRIYARAAAEAAGMTGLNANTEIVVTLNGVGNAQIVAELDNIEEINVNALNVTSPGGVPPGGTGGNGGDTILVIGDFNPTSLNFNTITVNGGRGADTVDISGLTSAHRLVFNTGGGADQFIGDARAQDVVNSGSSGNGHGGGSVHQQDNPLQMIRALMDDWMEANGRSSLRDVRHYFDTDYLFS